MSLDDAILLTRAALAFALAQQSLEHIFGPYRRDRAVFWGQLLLAGAIVASPWPAIACLAATGVRLALLQRFDGPYNGGADRMTVLVLLCLTAALLVPGRWAEIAMGYLAVQLAMSYFMSGWVKLRNPDWRSGQALADVFLMSAYPVSENLRALAGRRRLLVAGSWAVIGLELAFPLALLHPVALYGVLGLAMAFHVANACLFGLNRFVWAWLAAYPSIIWLQDRLLV